ncbi:MAG TPA: leucine--tRNA ligase [Polyangiaceae bacterium]|nr:leucine--tRNA ligase [Polyangiaceae bacterium]
MSEAPREHYAPSVIEPKWQRLWSERATFRAVRHPARKKLYLLDMFPYPSGSGLHVGHPEGYTATDIVARYSRMRGIDVLHPMGWDAFGLPAEQHALATNTHPRDTTRKNIATFKRQLQMLGFSYDWSREIDTTDPGYVKWTQWIFLKLFERGLAYQAEIPVNWCPELGTVLANEEVIDGVSERGGHPVERLPLRQWMLRITAYADRLDADLETLDWPDTKAKQHQWIGRSEGTEIDFDVVGGPSAARIRVFTTRSDTLPGVTYIVLAPEHPLVATLVSPQNAPAVTAYVEAARRKSDFDRTESKTKTGVPLGARARNPITGQDVPIWVADYVIATYGTGAVMAVPAHDERDHAFASVYGLPVVPVIEPAGGGVVDVRAAAFTEDGVVRYGAIEADVPDGTPSSEARRRITAWLAAHGRGGAKVTYRLRDWVFSRQRYWGEPIPIYFPVSAEGDPRAPGAKYTIHYDRPIALAEDELPLRLPDLDDFGPGNDPAGPLARLADWRFFERSGRWYARETNTMPQWAGSCWYYLRYLDPRDEHEPWTSRSYDDWMPVDLYVGGSEHAVLHLLYARFWHKVLYDAGLVKDAEPFVKLVHQGMILGENNEKMSKARGNVVNPDDVVRTHGADALRVYEMFMGPLEQVKPWQTSGIEGVRRFLERVWNVVTGPLTTDPVHYGSETRRLVHKSIQKVTLDIEALRFNTAISTLMILVRNLASSTPVPRDAAVALVLLLSPFAPHIGEELWQRLGESGPDGSLAYAPWPVFDAALVRDEVVEIGVQVNGKLRGTIRVSVDADEDAARQAALSEPRVQRHLEGRNVKKFFYVKGRIVSFIVE